jgi:ribosome maturation factor RimP
MDLKEKIQDLAEKSLTNPTHFLVEVLVSKHKPWKFTVIVDGDQGITIDDCAVVSRTLNELLESEISDPYTLEVSTPGLDHPLKLKRQYQKNVGRGMKVVRKDKSIVIGSLKQTEEEKIVIETEIGQGKKTELKVIEIPFTEIEKAFVTVSFK